MAIRKLIELLNLARENTPRTFVIVSANDTYTLLALQKAIDENLINAILIGDEFKIISICHDNHIDQSKLRIINQPDNELAASHAIELINSGEGDVLMKGLITTDLFMKAILNKETGLIGSGQLLTHVAVIENNNYHKLIIAGDVAVIPQPDLNQKKAIINYLVMIAKLLGTDIPKIAVIAPTEKILPSIASTLDAELLFEMNRNGIIQGCIVGGPFALDVALDAEAARVKGINSPVAGDADCLLFPNLDAGNVFYKTITKLAQSETASIVVGAKVPVVLASRGDSMLTKLYSIALGALIGQTNVNHQLINSN
jgi:phosphotransacetylase